MERMDPICRRPIGGGPGAGSGGATILGTMNVARLVAREGGRGTALADIKNLRTYSNSEEFNCNPSSVRIENSIKMRTLKSIDACNERRN